MPYDIGSTLKTCRNNAKISVKQISEILTEKGFKASESTIYSWENGNSQPTPGALLIMCRAYGVKDVLTTFGYDGYNDDGSIILNLIEIEHIEKYRALDEHGKDMVDTVLSKEHDRCQADPAVSTAQHIVPLIKESSPYEVNAAHADELQAPEDVLHDDDIMDNDDEWK